MRRHDEGLEPWLDRQYRYAAAAMLESVSPVRIVKTRPGFGQTIRPRKGSVVASPVSADWTPEPDYFFHWYRDSALVMDALRLKRGNAFLETVRAFTPPGGDMSEQFDQRTGVQTSARHLAWSYAAFITCIAARRLAVPEATHATGR
jgi:GH15 family glucan-1,4-alpha-glucosidase